MSDAARRPIETPVTEPPLQRLRARLHPESGAGGFSAIDGTVIFYTRIAALLRPETTVLDLGAGRGRAHVDDPVSFRRSLMDLRGRCAKVIGADPDPAVLANPSLDEAVVTPEGRPRPAPGIEPVIGRRGAPPRGAPWLGVPGRGGAETPCTLRGTDMPPESGRERRRGRNGGTCQQSTFGSEGRREQGGASRGRTRESARTHRGTRRSRDAA